MELLRLWLEALLRLECLLRLELGLLLELWLDLELWLVDGRTLIELGWNRVSEGREKGKREPC